ncbi:MAG: YbjQ family protein [bacterium]|jgi:uncharacterized protein YbjQ (UPF0145 family)|nr:heavy metal-binding domain-containing protein [Planctomycetota bacterium]HIL52571.1 heavy metal-binding domain-containing protein [Planctomycetota bacterium]
MIVTTCESLPNRTVAEVLGLVQGSAVRARHLGKDITALFTNIVGGEMVEYTKLLAESREQALDRLREEARAQGGNAVLALRFSSTQISAGAAEILVYGTAVRLEEQDAAS